MTIATYTPTALAVPKADATGKLDLNWFSINALTATGVTFGNSMSVPLTVPARSVIIRAFAYDLNGTLSATGSLIFGGIQLGTISAVPYTNGCAGFTPVGSATSQPIFNAGTYNVTGSGFAGTLTGKIAIMLWPVP